MKDPCKVAFVCFILMVFILLARLIIGDAEVPLDRFFPTLYNAIRR